MPNIQVAPGAERFFFEGNDIGCLVIHGFTSSPQVVRFYGEFLAKEGGFTVIGPRLPGHGTTLEDLAQYTAEDFLHSLEAEIETLHQSCSKLFVTGLSLGALLSIHLAAAHPNLFSGVMPINGAVFNGNPEFAAGISALDESDIIPNEEPDTKKPDVKELVYSGMPVSTLRTIIALAADTHQLLPDLVCPILIFQSRVDHVLSPDNGPLLLEKVGAEDKRLVWLENSYHVATLDHDKELIAQEALQFIRQHI